MAKTPNKIIITCAVTGSVHTPTMSPHLPITPTEITNEAVAASEAGAAIIHLHARDPESGKPTADPAVFNQFLPRIKQATAAVVNITSGHYGGLTVEERLAAIEKFSPEPDHPIAAGRGGRAGLARGIPGLPRNSDTTFMIASLLEAPLCCILR